MRCTRIPSSILSRLVDNEEPPRTLWISMFKHDCCCWGVGVLPTKSLCTRGRRLGPLSLSSFLSGHAAGRFRQAGWQFRGLHMHCAAKAYLAGVGSNAAFLEKRGKLLRYGRFSPEHHKQLDEARTKQWATYMSLTVVKLIPESEHKSFVYRVWSASPRSGPMSTRTKSSGRRPSTQSRR